jgi:hypothetical protein
MEKSFISTVRIAKTGSASFPLRNQDVIISGLPISLWVNNDKICLTQKKSAIPEDADAKTTMFKHYGKSTYRKVPPYLLLGKELTAPMNINGKYVSYYEDGEIVTISLATPEEMGYRGGKSFHGKTNDGEVRSGQYMYLSQVARDRLGVAKGDLVKITINIQDGVWVEISSADTHDAIPGLQAVMKEAGLKYSTPPDRIPPLTYTTRYRDWIKLPMMFLRAAGLDITMKEATQLPYWFEVTDEGTKMIVEGLPQICHVCGKTARTYKHKIKHLNACPDCLSPLEAVREAAEKYGSLDAALEAGDSELEKLLLETADKLTKLTKMMERKAHAS